ncbi:uncharacterized protein PHACADRAFT_30227 [Phanerochaete carnosa HHB-10118-sp]|uniref:Uncharacterized protein n=1 Tax=Phanerochaete carnosa (strain HHB-10118-sp) TaxID=650164 RepID=K5VNZ2_PHACS|nr:uncharacterized protein PHACADRAFT_30227 [Phanerochaete carnosa HHB-10118-sp]EKM53193.1 hypothetical protein PHACADRAFT_30227 [Phanerochaete carnosa HHB-10118-sp]
MSFLSPPPTPPWLVEAQRACQLIRQEYLSEKKRRRHLKTILDFVDSYIHWVLTSHSGVGPLGPVLECALDYGNEGDRMDLVQHLKGWYATLAQRREHKMLVMKILHLCPPARPLIFRELQRYGVVPLLLNYEAMSVLLSTFDNHANEEERAILVCGMYGRVACAAADLVDVQRGEGSEKAHIRGLSQIMQECYHPGKVYLILGAARSNLLTIFCNPNPTVPSSAMFHRALLEYLQALDTLPNKQVAETFRRDIVQKHRCLQHMEFLTFSPEGSRVVGEINAIVQRSTDIVPLPIGIVPPTPYAMPGLSQ